MQQPEREAPAVAGDADPVEAIGRAAHALNSLLAADEAGLHVMERSFMTVWLESAAREAPLRPGRRMQYIEPIVDALADVLKPAARTRLKHALAVVLGTEAIIALPDVGRADAAGAVAATTWAARALVRQALAEAGQDH